MQDGRINRATIVQIAVCIGNNKISQLLSRLLRVLTMANSDTEYFDTL